MKIGDLVRYRSRKPEDPPPPGSWGEIGLVINLTHSRFRENFKEPAVEYINDDGDFITARQDDVEAINEGRWFGKR